MLIQLKILDNILPFVVLFNFVLPVFGLLVFGLLVFGLLVFGLLCGWQLSREFVHQIP